nr:hypothetical protein [Lachnospiraceae bacterium]
MIRKLNKTALILALVHFVISFFTDRLIFEYVLLDFSTVKLALRSVEAWVVKAAFLVLLIALWQWIFWTVRHADRRFVKVASGYMILMAVLLLLTWPGIWRMDEFGILSSSVQLFPHFWQNYITSVFYIFSLMLIPVPAGVVVVQCICISLIAARIVTLCTEKGKEWWMIPVFLMFPVLDSNLYPIRMSLYAFLELLLIAELFFCWKEERRENSRSYWWGLTALAAVVTIWRTEAVYYLVAYPVLLLMLGKGRKYSRQILCYIILVVILFMPQKVGEKLTSGDQYELTSVVLPLVPLVEAAAGDGEEELLSSIDQVVNVEVTLQGAAEGKSGINLFWGDFNLSDEEAKFQRTYDDEQFSEFKSAFYKLVIKYPDVFLAERWQTFRDSSDLLENTTDLFVKDNVPNYAVFQSYPLSGPIHNELRTSVIKILELRDFQDYNIKRPVTDMVYSAVPAIVVLLAAAVVLLARRKWTPAVLVLTVFAKVPLVFLTAPSRLFMYYYSAYLIGYCLLFYAVCCVAGRRKQAAGQAEGKAEESHG